MAFFESSDSSSAAKDSSNITSEEVAENVEENENAGDMRVLSLVWKNGKLGAAFYDYESGSLNVYEELLEASPLFFYSSSVFREVAPRFLITIGKVSDEFVKHLINVATQTNEANTTTTETNRNIPYNMFLLPTKEYSFDICRNVLLEINLVNAEGIAAAEKELYVNSLLNFDNKTSIYAAGALIKYLDKNWAHFLPTKDDLQFLQVLQISMKHNVLMDWTSLNALQVFQKRSHDACFKRGLQSSAREGVSIFRLFSSNCKSKIGQTSLRNLLLKPINDVAELTNRLDFISFVLHPSHQEFVESLQDNIKKLSDVTIILFKIQNSRATFSDWKTLYESIYHSVFLGELTVPYLESCQLLSEFYNSITNELMCLENSMSCAIDFTDSKSSGRPVIKMGLDESLDAKKLHRQDMARHVNAAAEIAAQQLPDYLNECAIVYLPEMGHLITIKKWHPDCNPEDLEEFGFRFLFTLRGTIHYKNPLCLELDESLGDINADIIAHENRILQRLSGFTVKYNKDIREPLRILATIDAFIAIAKVSAQNNYIRPDLNNENIHEIYDCRHPLLELSSTFESNDFFSGGNHSHIKVISGPNGSGKSVYLKQVALVIYLAHVGSFVPAKAANIGMLHSIHSRMQATESASVRLSSFMIDATQSSQAIRNGHPNSLVLLDEFGKGTTKEEGFAMFWGILKHFHKMGTSSPHVLVSTHYQCTADFLPQDSVVEYLKMMHTEEDGVILFLYKIAKGVSNSFAFNIFEQLGFDQDIINRASELFQVCGEVQKIRVENVDDQAFLNFLADVDIPSVDN